MRIQFHRKPTIAALLMLEFSLIFLSWNKNKKFWRISGGSIRKSSSKINTPSNRTRHRHRYTHPLPVIHRHRHTRSYSIRLSSNMNNRLTSSSNSNSRDKKRLVHHRSHHYRATIINRLSTNLLRQNSCCQLLILPSSLQNYFTWLYTHPTTAFFIRTLQSLLLILCFSVCFPPNDAR